LNHSQLTLTAHDCEESSKVFNAVLLGVTDQEASDDGHQCVEGHEGTTLSKLVGEESDNKGVNGTSDVRWGRQEKRELVGVSLSSENDGQEVGKGVTL
jgi:hypothetical protein